MVKAESQKEPQRAAYRVPVRLTILATTARHVRPDTFSIQLAQRFDPCLFT